MKCITSSHFPLGFPIIQFPLPVFQLHSIVENKKVKMSSEINFNNSKFVCISSVFSFFLPILAISHNANVLHSANVCFRLQMLSMKTRIIGCSVGWLVSRSVSCFDVFVCVRSDILPHPPACISDMPHATTTVCFKLSLSHISLFVH